MLQIRYLLFLSSVVVLLTSCKQRLDEFEPFFGTADLSKGNYKLIGIGLEGLWVDDFRNFYIDDVQTLQQMQNQWVLDYSVPATACGYGYYLKLVKDTVVIKEAYVNLECEYLYSKEHPWRSFPANYLTDHKASFKTLSEAQLKGLE